MSAFDVDDAELSVAYSVDVTSAGSASTSWVTATSSGLGVEMTSTNTQAELIDTYTVTVTATAGCSLKTASFTVVVASPCASDTLTIAPISDVSYHVGDSATPIAWDSSIVTSTGGYSFCGDYAWTLIDKDTGVAPITDLFTVTITDGAVAYVDI